MDAKAGHVHGPTSGRKLWISPVITLVFCAGETFAGLISHSLALLSDAGHNLSDALALGLAAYAVYAMQKPASGNHTYGYYRVSTLTALFNASSLVVIAIFIGLEAISRFRHPEPVVGQVMISVAFLAVIMNTVIALVLSKDAKLSLNSKAAFIHMAGDALSSFAVVIAGIVIHYTRWPHADPLVSLLIAGFILWSAFGIVKEATDILMEKAPQELDLKRLAARIMNIDAVCGLHDLHVWTVGEGKTLLSCHVALPVGYTLDQSADVISVICKTVHDDFLITHATIQPEVEGVCNAGMTKTLYCDMDAHSSGGTPADETARA